MSSYTCECCGFSQEIESDELFEKLDWEKVAFLSKPDTDEDRPDKILCPLCPDFYTTERAVHDHSAVHDTWSRLGRPEEFSTGTCLLEEDKARVATVESLGEKLFQGMPLSEKRLVSSALNSIHFHTSKLHKALEDWATKPRQESIW